MRPWSERGLRLSSPSHPAAVAVSAPERRRQGSILKPTGQRGALLHSEHARLNHRRRGLSLVCTRADSLLRATFVSSHRSSLSPKRPNGYLRPCFQVPQGFNLGPHHGSRRTGLVARGFSLGSPLGYAFSPTRNPFPCPTSRHPKINPKNNPNPPCQPPTTPPNHQTPYKQRRFLHKILGILTPTNQLQLK